MDNRQVGALAANRRHPAGSRRRAARRQRLFLPRCLWPALVIGILAGAVAAAQPVITAESFFSQVAATYRGIDDYEADIRITQRSGTMTGRLSYKRPNLLRIDFTDPAGQVIVSDGSVLTIYYPALDVIFEQKLSDRGDDGGVSLASRQGLDYLRNNYSIAYVEGPDPVPLDEGSSEMVVKLNLNSRSATEGFRQLEIAVSAGNLIRRITGITVGLEEHRFDFLGVRTNQEIPEQRFVYISPASANVYRDFLFDSED